MSCRSRRRSAVHVVCRCRTVGSTPKKDREGRRLAQFGERRAALRSQNATRGRFLISHPNRPAGGPQPMSTVARTVPCHGSTLPFETPQCGCRSVMNPARGRFLARPRDKHPRLAGKSPPSSARRAEARPTRSRCIRNPYDSGRKTSCPYPTASVACQQHEAQRARRRSAARARRATEAAWHRIAGPPRVTGRAPATVQQMERPPRRAISVVHRQEPLRLWCGSGRPPSLALARGASPDRANCGRTSVLARRPTVGF